MGNPAHLIRSHIEKELRLRAAKGWNSKDQDAGKGGKGIINKGGFNNQQSGKPPPPGGVGGGGGKYHKGGAGINTRRY